MLRESLEGLPFCGLKGNDKDDDESPVKSGTQAPSCVTLCLWLSDGETKSPPSWLLMVTPRPPGKQPPSSEAISLVAPGFVPIRVDGVSSPASGQGAGPGRVSPERGPGGFPRLSGTAGRHPGLLVPLCRAASAPGRLRPPVAVRLPSPALPPADLPGRGATLPSRQTPSQNEDLAGNKLPQMGGFAIWKSPVSLKIPRSHITGQDNGLQPRLEIPTVFPQSASQPITGPAWR